MYSPKKAAKMINPVLYIKGEQRHEAGQDHGNEPAQGPAPSHPEFKGKHQIDQVEKAMRGTHDLDDGLVVGEVLEGNPDSGQNQQADANGQREDPIARSPGRQRP